MPLYNCEAFVGEAIDSIRNQTMEDWELIVVDDASTDASAECVSEKLDDARINLLRFDRNSGPAAARTAGIMQAQGRYIAFLDSDDLWLPEKLETQLAFMDQEHCGMCFTSYETIYADGTHYNYVHVPDAIDYRGFMKNTITCAHTIAFDTMLVDKGLLRARDDGSWKDYPEDLDVWLHVLKSGQIARGLDVCLAKYRKHAESRSARPFRAAHRTWNQYRHREQLGFMQAAYCLFWQLFHAMLKRVR